MDRVVRLGCIVCRLFHDTDESPAEIHHIVGKTDEGAHFKVLGLCVPHHRHAQPGGPYQWATRHTPGRYAGLVQFEAAYGSEQALLEKTYELLGEELPA